MSDSAEVSSVFVMIYFYLAKAESVTQEASGATLSILIMYEDDDWYASLIGSHPRR